MPSKIVVVGSLNMDLVACAPRIPVPGETVTGHTFFSLQNVDILTPNETEASVLTGMPPGRIEASEAVEVGKKIQAREC